MTSKTDRALVEIYRLLIAQMNRCLMLDEQFVPSLDDVAHLRDIACRGLDSQARIETLEAGLRHIICCEGYELKPNYAGDPYTHRTGSPCPECIKAKALLGEEG